MVKLTFIDVFFYIIIHVILSVMSVGFLTFFVVVVVGDGLVFHAFSFVLSGEIAKIQKISNRSKTVELNAINLLIYTSCVYL